MGSGGVTVQIVLDNAIHEPNLHGLLPDQPCIRPGNFQGAAFSPGRRCRLGNLLRNFLHSIFQRQANVRSAHINAFSGRTHTTRRPLGMFSMCHDRSDDYEQREQNRGNTFRGEASKK